MADQEENRTNSTILCVLSALCGFPKKSVANYRFSIRYKPASIRR